MVNCVPSHFRALCSIIFFMFFPVSAWVLSTSGAQSSSMCVHRVAAHTFSLTSALSDISFPAALRGWAVPWWFLEPGEIPPVLTEAARPHGCQNFDIYTSSRRKSLCVEWRQETKLGIYPILFVSETKSFPPSLGKTGSRTGCRRLSDLQICERLSIANNQWILFLSWLSICIFKF